MGRDIEFKIQSNDVIHSFWIPALAGKKDAVPGRTHELVLNADEVGIFEGQCTEYCGLSHGVMRMQVKALEQADYDVWVERMTTPPEQPDEDERSPSRASSSSCTQCSFCHEVNGLDPNSTAPYTYCRAPEPGLRSERRHHHGVGQRPEPHPPDDARALRRRPPADSTRASRTAEAVPSGEPDVNNIKRWLRDPEEVKPMDPNNDQGMPNYNLSEEQIDQLDRLPAHPQVSRATERGTNI